MSDITKCVGEGCPFKEHCKRVTSITNEHYQSWFLTSPIVNNTCKQYLSTYRVIIENGKYGLLNNNKVIIAPFYTRLEDLLTEFSGHMKSGNYLPKLEVDKIINYLCM